MKKLNIFIILTVICVIACIAQATDSIISMAKENDEQDSNISGLQKKLDEVEKNARIELDRVHADLRKKDEKLRDEMALSNETLVNRLNVGFAKANDSINRGLNHLKDYLMLVVIDSTNHINHRITESTSKLWRTLTTQDEKLRGQSLKLSDLETTLKAHKAELDTEVNQLWLSIAPVGTILPFTGSNAPSNWVICNGRRINDPTSSYHNQDSPDLQGLFIRGKKPEESLGGKYGKDTIGPHRHGIPEHKHSIASQDVDFETFDDFNKANGAYCRDGLALRCLETTNPGEGKYVIAGDEERDLTHSHDGSITIPRHETSSQSLRSNPAGGHSNIPRYVAYYYIMRIK